MSKSDPKCKIFYKLSNGQVDELGYTETLKNDLNPIWKKAF